ncbi:class I SAM-dependent methyltransferase [Thermogemmatispora carboxidivorans]|uniref:class I SAM-dependent methyltransferase n=1 Tax=Thermogemmatispora carboxidivorans TaxID=1382306 RepID=UPI00069B90A0|nr:class I SAM-dependent methyltransferase [Thermogemmatispora carboxidivorans]
MPWWFFRRRGGGTLSTGATGQASGTGWRLGDVALPRLQGRRRYLQEQPYLLPKDLGEVNRLDFQHYMLRAALRGNYLAPIGQPRRILDVGCGTGRWAIELAQQFPQAEVIGVDVEQAKSTSRMPSNYRFVRGDVLQGLPFEENTFDFVHQRLLLLAIPLAAWPGVVQELVRVTAPGGWVELVEGSISANGFVPCGPATQQLLDWMGQLAALRGLDTEGEVMRSLERYLAEAGLINIQRRPLEVPVGDWGGRLGSLMALDFKEGAKAVSGPIAARFGRSEQEVLDMIEQVNHEWNALQTKGYFMIVYGQKPLTG